MSEGMIPLGSDLPIEVSTVDDSKIYQAIIDKWALSPKLDKNGVLYSSLVVIIAEGDFEGKSLSKNYMPVIMPIDPDAPKSVRIKTQDRNVDMARMVRAFKIKGEMPVANPQDGDSLQKWQEWANSHVGSVGKVAAANEEYQGRARSVLRDFVV